MYVLVITKIPLTEHCIARTAEAAGVASLSIWSRGADFDWDSPTLRIRIETLEMDFTDWGDEPDRVLRLENLGPDARIYFVHYKSVGRLRDVLVPLVSCTDCIVDDDCELFVTGQEFIALCEANPSSNSWWLGGCDDVRYCAQAPND